MRNPDPPVVAKSDRRLTIESALAMSALLVLAVGWSWRHHSGINDMYLHYGLVEFIADHWRWPVDVPYLSGMNQHPPVSHTVAAIVASLCGSRIFALHLVSVVSEFFVYATLFWLLRFRDPRATIVATTVVTILTIAIAPWHAGLGHELSSNFFFSQLFGEMCVFLLVWLRSQFALALLPELITSIAATFLLGWVYPVAAVQFGGIAVAWRALLIGSSWRANGRLSRSDVMSFAVIVAGVALAIVLHPRFAALVGMANVQEVIVLPVPGGLVVLATGLLLVLTIVLGLACARGTLALRTPEAFVALCGGVGGASLAQEAAYYLLGLGTSYAVYKHVFAVTTLLVCAAVVCIIHLTRYRVTGASDAKSRRLAHLAFAPATIIVLLVNAAPWGGSMAQMVRAERFYREALAEHPEAEGHAVAMAGEWNEAMAFSLGIFHLPVDKTSAMLIERLATPQQRSEIIQQTPIIYLFLPRWAVANPACAMASDPSNSIVMVRSGCPFASAGNGSASHR